MNGTAPGHPDPAMPADASIRTLTLTGTLDIMSVRDVGATLSEAVGDMSRELVVDLRDVTFMDSTGLGALARAAQQLANQGRELTLLVTPGGPVEGLLDVSGMQDVFVVEPA